MGLDDKVLQVCKEAAMENIHDVSAALKSVKVQLKIPPLPPWIIALVDNALREQIHYARHVSNRKVRKALGRYGGPGKAGSSSALEDVANTVWQQSVFNHTINGWRLGNIAKDELLAMADIEDEKAAGSLFNAAVCRQLSTLCSKKKGETVEECLSERQVEAVFAKVAKDFDSEAA